MDREIVLATLALVLSGFATTAGCWWAGEARSFPSAAEMERRAWWQLWAPLVPAALMAAGLLGWALLEPDDAEAVPVTYFFVASPFAAILLRAGLRLARAAVGGAGDLPAATIGLLRPRAVVSARLAGALDRAALDAVSAHERAHAVHYDPLRVWLAGLAADLQWPWPAAAVRLRRWKRSLELARDEEARRWGARGEDLAEAIIVAVRLSQPPATNAAVGALTGDEVALKERIVRLLEPVQGTVPVRRPWGTALLVALVCAALLGIEVGESTVRALLAMAP